MKRQGFKIFIAGLRSGDAESLVGELARAAVRVQTVDRSSGTVSIESRGNAPLSADDVLEVVAEWLDRDVRRLATVTVAVQWFEPAEPRTSIGARGLHLLQAAIHRDGMSDAHPRPALRPAVVPARSAPSSRREINW